MKFEAPSPGGSRDDFAEDRAGFGTGFDTGFGNGLDVADEAPVPLATVTGAGARVVSSPEET